MLRLSIIIATYNRGPYLMRTLSSLLTQTLNQSLWEAVVVNNNSTDNTEELFAQFVKDHPQLNVRMIKETRQGVSYACNRGIEESSGEYIAIVDDDEEVNAEFAEAYVTFFDTFPHVAAAGGKITPLYEFDPPKWLSPYAERPIAGRLDMGSKPVPFRGENYPGGGNMGIRRSIVEKYGAFNPELGRTGNSLLGGEEKDLFRRLRAAGEKVYYVPNAEILHIIPESKLNRAYFSKLTKMIGVSERVRTRNISPWAYIKRLGAEVVKWGGTVIIAAWYTLTLRPSQAGYLFILRWNISRGLLGLLPKGAGRN